MRRLVVSRETLSEAQAEQSPPLPMVKLVRRSATGFRLSTWVKNPAAEPSVDERKGASNLEAVFRGGLSFISVELWNGPKWSRARWFCAA